MNIQDHNLRTPLHHAVNMAGISADGSFEVEDLLLSHGADINALDKFGRTPIHYALLKFKEDFENQS